MSRKYELTGITVTYGKTILHRIKALKDFGDVKKGYLGGWIESEDNLSQEGRCWVHGNSKVYGNAEVSGNVKVYGNAEVFGNAKVYDNAEVFGNAKVCVDAEIKNPTDYIVIGPIGSRNDCTTFYKTKDSNIRVVCGCFNGTLEEFEKAVKKTHEGTRHEKVYMDAIAFVKRTFS